MAAPEQRLCSHCDLNRTETELHFLTECSKYTDIGQDLRRRKTHEAAAEAGRLYNYAKRAFTG